MGMLGHLGVLVCAFSWYQCSCGSSVSQNTSDAHLKMLKLKVKQEIIQTLFYNSVVLNLIWLKG